MRRGDLIASRAEKVLMMSGKQVTPLVVDRGSGCWVYDVDGRRYLDFCSSIAVALVGHCHPEVTEAIKRQCDKLLHYTLASFIHESAVSLAEKLLELTGKADGKVFFTNSGTEAIEGAIKVSRGFFKGSRPWILGFVGSFHGRSLGSLSITSSKSVQRKWFSPLLPCVEHTPYPYCYRCPFKLSLDACDLHCASYLEDYVFNRLVDPSEVCCLVFEPIQGEGGCIVPPPGFWERVERICRSHGILMVADEVQTGLGRTGMWFAYEHWRIKPHVVCLSKGLASGLPLGAIVGDGDVMSLPRGSHASTLGGNPVCCSSALATINVIEKNNLLENASRIGGYITKRLRELKEKVDIMGDVRGLGLLIGVELVDDKGRANHRALEIALREGVKRGLLLSGSGTSTIRITPPLSITLEEAEEGLSILEEVLMEVEKLV